MVQTSPASSLPEEGPDSGARGRGLDRSGEKKREILDAAARVFRRAGARMRPGMRDIAAELGMAVGNLYYYFKDKEDLLAFVQEDALGGLLALAERVRATCLCAGRPGSTC